MSELHILMRGVLLSTVALDAFLDFFGQVCMFQRLSAPLKSFSEEGRPPNIHLPVTC